MKFFLAAIVTAALLVEIIPVWAADPGNDKIKNTAPSVHTEADNSNGHPPEGISITPQTQAQRLAAATAKAQPSAKAPADTASSDTSPADADIKAPPADMQPEPPKPVIKKIKPPIPEEKPLRVIWPQDFYYYSYNGDPYYSLSLPKDFGADTLAGLPAEGPMLVRAHSNTLLMSFTAAGSDTVRAKVFGEALKTRTEIPLPPLGPNEEYEYIPAPRYTYHTDTAPLELPKQITNVKIVDAGSGRTAENLIVQYLYLSCTADGQHCMAVLTHSERNQKAFDGLFVFPYAEKQNYIPLVTFTAQSLRVRK